jgi:hypothetical protein
MPTCAVWLAPGWPQVGPRHDRPQAGLGVFVQVRWGGLRGTRTHSLRIKSPPRFSCQPIVLHAVPYRFRRANKEPTWTRCLGSGGAVLLDPDYRGVRQSTAFV